MTVHGCRESDREIVTGLPCTTVIQTLLDVAATEPLKLVMRSLAQLDYERRLDADTVRAACGRGRPGSTALLTALDGYVPQLARTRSELEEDFLRLCQQCEIPLPQVNALLHGIEVDCHWPGENLVVELDGQSNHGTSAQRNRDQNRALKLRAHGVQLVRYTHLQVNREAATVAADLLAQLRQRRGPILILRMDTLAFEHHLTSPQGEGHRPADAFTVTFGGGDCCDEISFSVQTDGDPRDRRGVQRQGLRRLACGGLCRGHAGPRLEPARRRARRSRRDR